MTLPFRIVDSINRSEHLLTKKEILEDMGLRPESYQSIFAILSTNKIISYDKNWRIVKGDNFYRYLLFCYKGKRLYHQRYK